MNVFEQIKNLLDKTGVEYTLSEHQPVRTSKEAAKLRGVDLKTGAKSMVLKSKGNYYLFVLPADLKIDWKKVKQILNTKEVRFATEIEAETTISVKMGSVPPFGNILNLPTFFDKRILDTKWVNFNPGSTTHSIQMKSEDLIKLVKPELVEIT